MKITKIAILNFLGISSFKTTKLGKMNRVTGGNGTGKSSVLKAITEAFKSSGIKPNIIRLGADRAEILIELDERILIERRITPTSNHPKVVVDGQPLNAPQKYLNDLIGQFTFNPVEFFLASAKERRRILLSSIPLSLDQVALFDMIGGDSSIPVGLEQYDYSGHGLEVLERIQKDIYERRHEQNLEVTRLKKSLEQDKLDIPDTFDGERYKGFDIQDKINELTAAKAAISQHEQDAAHLERLRQRSVQIKTEIERLEAEIKRLKTEREKTQDEGMKLFEEVDSFKAPDTAALEADINDYNQSQKLMLKIEEIERKQGEIEESAKVHGALNDFYKTLTTQVPRQLLSKVQLPVDNLEIKGDDILVDGKSLDNLSNSEQIKFAINIARSLAGDLKVICVDRFESLDKAARAAFEKEVNQDDFEYFITVVTEGDLKMESVNGGDSTARPATKSTTKQAGKQVDAGF